ncbi:hypothetical protein EV702DRAFT_1010299 [Suillus placidus]|uniref:Uncharacterized protein n=1 Tax=Suillus placidus TaxID=48579 RepID=A0A9P6ZN48_9AGAM|nr:hypothetical protein EV702DRAFT_1010299 [Suillus placidus]
MQRRFSIWNPRKRHVQMSICTGLPLSHKWNKKWPFAQLLIIFLASRISNSTDLQEYQFSRLASHPFDKIKWDVQRCIPQRFDHQESWHEPSAHAQTRVWRCLRWGEVRSSRCETYEGEKSPLGWIDSTRGSAGIEGRAQGVSQRSGSFQPQARERSRLVVSCSKRRKCTGSWGSRNQVILRRPSVHGRREDSFNNNVAEQSHPEQARYLDIKRTYTDSSVAPLAS